MLDERTYMLRKCSLDQMDTVMRTKRIVNE